MSITHDGASSTCMPPWGGGERAQHVSTDATLPDTYRTANALAQLYGAIRAVHPITLALLYLTALLFVCTTLHCFADSG
jgi:hypothetical protein